MLNILNQLLFCHLTKRKLKIDIWQISDIIALIFVFLIYVDISGIYSEDYNNPSHITTIIRAAILCVNNIFVWMRIVGILLTFKSVGPLIRMMYEMSILMIKILTLYTIWVICSAAVFTSIFFNYSTQFPDFSTAIFNLLGGFIQNFTLKPFTKFLELGEVLYGLFVTISGILLINLLIAMLNSIYESMNSIADAAHRSVIISYYRRYKWNEKYGYLIFLTTPLNVLNWITLPLSRFCIRKKNRKKFNKIILKFYYLFYFSFFLVMFLAYSLLLIPLCYIKGIIYETSQQFHIRINPVIKVLNISKWLIFGIFFLIYIYVCDIKDIFTSMYYKTDIHANATELNRLKKLISPEDVVTFIQFVHSKKSNDQIDFHLIFQDYLAFEQNKKAETNESMRETSNYLKSLTSHTNMRNNKTLYSSLMIHNKDDHDTSLTGSYMKKNLIIIEILENFKIEDNFGMSQDVDSKKLKMLLPKTMNIDSNFTKRLVHTDINSMNKAINQLKHKKDIFQQNQLTNKIISLTIKIDKLFDSEIMLVYRKKITELTRLKSHEDLDDSEGYNLGVVENLLKNICEQYKGKTEIFDASNNIKKLVTIKHSIKNNLD